MAGDSWLFRNVYCESRHRQSGGYYGLLHKCAICPLFDTCRVLSEDTKSALMSSEYMEPSKGRFATRRKKMYIFVLNNGDTVPAYEGFDPGNPNWAELRDVAEVLVINKVLVPKMKLVPKSKEERSVIDQANMSAEQAPAPKKRRSRKAKK